MNRASVSIGGSTRFVPDARYSSRETKESLWLAWVCYGYTGGTEATEKGLLYHGHGHASRMPAAWVERAKELYTQRKTVGEAVVTLLAEFNDA